VFEGGGKENISIQLEVGKHQKDASNPSEEEKNILENRSASAHVKAKDCNHNKLAVIE
jgi:hypothetical protein